MVSFLFFLSLRSTQVFFFHLIPPQSRLAGPSVSSACRFTMPISKGFRKGLLCPALLIQPPLEDTAFLNTPNSEVIHGQLLVTPSAKGSGDTLPILLTHGIFLHATRQCTSICKFSVPLQLPELGTRRWAHVLEIRDSTLWEANPTPHMLACERPLPIHISCSASQVPPFYSCQGESLGVCVHTCWDGGTPGLVGCWLNRVPKAATRW